jgi:hypothetical protein
MKNTRQEKIKILLIDHLPLSSDEKVKVSLLEPVIPKHEKEKKWPVFVNKDNNVEWELEIAEGEERTVEIKYSVETPKSRDIEFHEY